MKKQMEQARVQAGKEMMEQLNGGDSTEKKEDFFQTEFDKEAEDSSNVGKIIGTDDASAEPVLKKAKLFEYRPRKFFNDYVVAGLNNTAFAINKYMPYAGGQGPVDPANGNDLNGLIRMGTTDLFEDIKLSGGFRIASNLRDNDVLFEFMNLRRRLDWGFTYYRSNQETSMELPGSSAFYPIKQFSSYYLARLSYPLDRVRSIRASIGPRFDRGVFYGLDAASLKQPDSLRTYGQLSLEYVYDNTINPTMNIWHGLRYKAYVDWFTQINDIKNTNGKFLFNAGFDARHYLPIYRNIIWAVRGAADFSWGSQKVVYYLGGVDGWLKFGSNQKSDGTYRYFDPTNQPDAGAKYAYQALAINLRGFKQNVANGNNSVVFNSEIRVPVFSTFFNRPINNAFLRNFQIVQFVDLGSAWNGTYDKIERPSVRYSDINSPITVKIKSGGIGPFAGGYGFGARSTLLGYFIRFDAAWQMDGIFRGKPQTYIALGVDF